jgi:hypothetical protein
MNDGFLLADCVFDSLFESGFIHYSEWKHETKELYYTASFILKGTRASTVSFEITVSAGRHKITRSILRILEKRFSKNFGDVFSNCAIF